MLVFVFAISSAVLWSQASSERKLKPPIAQAKRAFASHCAACHGLDARGSERAPNLVDRANGPRFSDSRLFQVIQDGIPAGGMPSFRSLGPSQISAIVRYLRTLQGTNKNAQLPGNPERGKQLFFSKGECSRCHMINGDGGFIASELSHYAADRTVEQIRTAITNPGGNVFPVVRLATVITHSGEKYVGRVRNEDNFSLQVQLLDGTFQSIRRSDLETLEYSKQPMMLAEYGSSLTSTELNDLISYLMSVAEASGAKTRRKTGIEEPIDEPD
jgi:cytochrome c oxidase cbb3-type subunit 3